MMQTTMLMQAMMQTCDGGVYDMSKLYS
jgi:hypothetical protein